MEEARQKNTWDSNPSHQRPDVSQTSLKAKYSEAAIVLNLSDKIRVSGPNMTAPLLLKKNNNSG